jgi:hypothetical protein
MNKIAPILRRIADSPLRLVIAGIALGALTAGCLPALGVQDKPQAATPPAANSAGATPSPTAAATPAAPVGSPTAAPATPAPPLPPILGFDEAVSKAAHALFTNAPAPDPRPALVVIDPLVDGMSGYQSKATQSIRDRINGVVKEEFPQYAVNRITPESLKGQPRVLVGTFTPVNAMMKTTGEREAYRFCLVMGDLKTGKIVAKSVVRVRFEGTDTTPTAAFSDSPVWTQDPSVQAYVATCQATKVGEPIPQDFIDGLLADSLISEADDAYDDRRYAEALDFYTTAHKSPKGDQLRVYNGLYLSLTKLGRTEQASAAFRDLVDYGLRKKLLAVKFLFRPGSVRFADSDFSNTYGMWLRLISEQAVSTSACLEIIGHTSPTGPAAMNESLSLLRAEYIQSRLEADEPPLKKRTVAAGRGSRENLIGTGRDDGTDVLDRRVELKPIEPCGG